MKEYLFFLSYAREDRDNDQEDLILRFFDDLGKALKRRGAAHGGFLDTWSTSTADVWTAEADQALRTCKIFVSIYSPNFFTREYCGKEWEIFQQRLELYRNTEAGKNAPSLIMPVLFLGKSYLEDSFRSMGPSVSDIVYHHKKDPLVYVEGGLEAFKLHKFRDDYQSFVMTFADRLFELSKNHPLPYMPDIASVADVESAFHKKKATRASSQAGQAKKVPNFVEFLFVVGTRDEMQKVREQVQGYGEGWLDWTPYEPDQSIGVRAQLIAGLEGFGSGVTVLEQDLTQWLRETKKRNRIAAIVVDSWALKAQPYANLVSDYDSYDSLHSLMLVCLNTGDKETQKKLREINTAVETVFQTKTLRGAQSNFLFPVNTSAEFEVKLVSSLGKIRMELLNRGLDQLRLKQTQTVGPSSSAPSLPSLPVPGA